MNIVRFQIKKYFDKLANGDWQKFYGTEINRTTYNFLTRKSAVLKLLGDTAFTKVLDIGCGSGEYLDIVKQCECQYYGIDFSEEMINRAVEKALSQQLSNTHLFVCEAEHLPFNENYFDLILGIGLIEYFEDPIELISEIKRVLRPGGVLIMQSFQYSFYDVSQSLSCGVKSVFRKRAVMQENIGLKVFHRRHSKNSLDTLLQNNDFMVLDYAYNNFRVIPYPFESFFPKTYIRISERLTLFFPKRFGYFAANYIGKYRRN